MIIDLIVYNVLGEIVIRNSNLRLDGTYSLDISALNSGIYYFNITSPNGSQVQKVIVK